MIKIRRIIILLITLCFYSINSMIANAEQKLKNVQYVDPETKPNRELEKILLKEIGSIPENEEYYPKYYYNLVDLDNDEIPEVIVYLVGALTCGNAGCPAYIFKYENGKYRKVTYFLTVNSPIIVSEKSTNGWRDLYVNLRVNSQIGGFVIVHFDGKAKRYPGIPSIDTLINHRDNIRGKAYFSDNNSFKGITLKPPKK